MSPSSQPAQRTMASVRSTQKPSLPHLVVLMMAVHVSCAPEFETSTQEVHAVCATETTVRGVDVSVYQGVIDWPAAARGGIRFALMRQSHGLTADNTFMRNWTGSRGAGIIRGAYQYFSASADPARQANLICDALIAVSFGPGDLPPMIDVEEPAPMGGSLPPPAQYADRVRTWLNIVRTRLGVEGIIYTGGYYWDSNLRTNEFASHPLWHAEYPNYPGTIYQVGVIPLPRMGCPQAISNSWPRWSFWQFAGNNGRAPGFGGAVDCDVFNGTFAQLQQLARVPGVGDAGVRVDAGIRTDSGPRADSGPRLDSGTRADAGAGADAAASEFDVPTETDAMSQNSRDAFVTPDARSGDSGSGANMTGGCGCRVDGPAAETSVLPRNSQAKIWSALLVGLAALSTRAHRRAARR